MVLAIGLGYLQGGFGIVKQCQSLAQIIQCHAITLMRAVLLSGPGVADTQQQLPAFYLCPHPDFTASATTLHAVMHGVFHQRLQQHRGQPQRGLALLQAARDGAVAARDPDTHAHLRGLSASVGPGDRKALRLGAAEIIKRVHFTELAGAAWFRDEAESLYAIRDFLEFKTTWHPIGA